MKAKLFHYARKLVSSRRRIVIVIIILALAAYFLHGKLTDNTDQPVIQTAQVERGTLVYSVTASGTVISSNIENITTQASGTVSKVYVSDGDQVYAGQKLAEIKLDIQGQQNYASSYSSYLSAVNSLNSARNSYRLTQASLAVVYDQIKGHDTDETLAMKETRTRAEIANDNAYDGIKAAETRLTSAALILNTSTPTITAPIAGTVKSVTIAEGMNIGASETASGSRANQRVATIATKGLPIATFNVSEIDVSSIKPGQKATITLDAITDKTFTGQVVSVDRVGSTTNNVSVYPVIIQLDTSSDQILPNMAATAGIILDAKSNVLIIPTTAVSYQGTFATVTLLQNNQQITQPVELGLANDTQIEVISGLSEGDIIIATTSNSSTDQQSQSQNRGGFFPGGENPVRLMR